MQRIVTSTGESFFKDFNDALFENTLLHKFYNSSASGSELCICLFNGIFLFIIFRYTEHSTVGLAQQWDQLDQLNMRMQKNLEHQIKAKNMTGVSEDTLKEFNIMFK